MTPTDEQMIVRLRWARKFILAALVASGLLYLLVRYLVLPALRVVEP